jgi:hypothetical protein
MPAVLRPTCCRLNALNEIWVPSAWQRQSFIQSGVDASKLVVVPEVSLRHAAAQLQQHNCSSTAQQHVSWHTRATAAASTAAHQGMRGHGVAAAQSVARLSAGASQPTCLCGKSNFEKKPLPSASALGCATLQLRFDFCSCPLQGVNTSLYDPALYTPLALRDKAQLVFGRHWEVKLGQQATAVLGAAANGSAADLMEHPAAAAAAADAESDAGANAVSTGALASGLETPGGGDGTDSAHRRAVLQKTKHRVDGQQQQQQQQQQQGSMGSPASAGVRQTGNGSQSAEAMQRIDSSSSSGGSTGAEGVRRPYRFISTFKWEERKGWSILLEAYLTAFTAEDDVE